MYALAVQHIPAGKEWLYEVKFDGYRGWRAETKTVSRFGRVKTLTGFR